MFDTIQVPPYKIRDMLSELLDSRAFILVNDFIIRVDRQQDRLIVGNNLGHHLSLPYPCLLHFGVFATLIFWSYGFENCEVPFQQRHY